MFTQQRIEFSWEFNLARVDAETNFPVFHVVRAGLGKTMSPLAVSERERVSAIFPPPAYISRTWG